MNKTLELENKLKLYSKEINKYNLTNSEINNNSKELKEIKLDKDKINEINLEKNEILCEHKIDHINTDYNLFDTGRDGKRFRENFELYLNNEKIDFKKNYKFNKIGLYTLKIKIIKEITDISYLFYHVSSLIRIDLSNFNSKKYQICHHYFKIVQL